MILLVLLICIGSFLLFPRKLAGARMTREYFMAALSGAFISTILSPFVLPVFRFNFHLGLLLLTKCGLGDVSSFIKPFGETIVVISLLALGVSTTVFHAWLGNRTNQDPEKPAESALNH